MGSAAEPDPAVDSTDPVPIAEELVDSMDPAQLAAQTQQAGSTGHHSVRQAEAPAGSTAQRMPLGQQDPQPGHPRSRKQTRRIAQLGRPGYWRSHLVRVRQALPALPMGPRHRSCPARRHASCGAFQAPVQMQGLDCSEQNHQQTAHRQTQMARPQPQTMRQVWPMDRHHPNRACSKRLPALRQRLGGCHPHLRRSPQQPASELLAHCRNACPGQLPDSKRPDPPWPSQSAA